VPIFDLLRFNRDLVTRLQPWLPDDVRLKAEVDAVTIESNPTGSLTIFVSDLFLRAPHQEAAVRAAHQILDAVQDFVSDATGEPWPPVQGDDVPTEMAAPTAEERDGIMELWYGDAGEPALALSPMRLSEYYGRPVP
jgi:hypothetical protein